MTIPDIIKLIEHSRTHVASVEENLASLEKSLRKKIRERMEFNGLDFGTVARRMGCQMHHLTNFFCNGQAMKPERLTSLLDAIQRKPNAKEKAAKKPQTSKRNPISTPKTHP